MKKKDPEDTGPIFNNLVAKHARKFNKASVFKDKTKYTRKEKHKNASF